MEYIIDMPDKWESPDGRSYDCAYCPFAGIKCFNRVDDCFLLSAKKAVECNINCDTRGVKSYIYVIKDGFKLYSVDERGDK